MRSLHLILAVLLAGCQSPRAIHTHGMALTATERTELERKAADGDAEAAWKLENYYSIELHEETGSDRWLRRAVELKHPQAMRSLALLIKDNNYSPAGFGSNAPAAFQSLLEQSAQTEGDACNELASAYAEGYFGSTNYSKARLYFQRGAGFNNRSCWVELSRYYRHGLGGARDDAEAYYWISLEACCVDPRSISGQETWQKREEIASHLSLPTLEREWKRIDDIMRQVTDKKVTVDFAPFLAGMIDTKLEAEGRRFAQVREDEHRSNCKSKNR